MTPTRIVLFGQRRSGTTLAFEAFRRVPGLTCYYEPLHPRLHPHPAWDGPPAWEDDDRGHWTEYRELAARLPDIYAPLGAPVFPVAQELDPAAWTPRHGDYLRALLDQPGPVLLQPVRTNHHLDAVIDACPDARFVWVLRGAEGVLSSQFRRSGGPFDDEVRRPARRGQRRRGADPPRAGWNQAKAADWVVEHRAYYATLRDEPPWIRALALWYDHLDVVTPSLARLPADRTAILRYEDLVAAPDETMARLCGWLEIDAPTVVDLVDPAAGAVHSPEDPRWAEGHDRIVALRADAGLTATPPSTTIPAADRAP